MMCVGGVAFNAFKYDFYHVCFNFLGALVALVGAERWETNFVNA